MGSDILFFFGQSRWPLPLQHFSRINVKSHGSCSCSRRCFVDVRSPPSPLFPLPLSPGGDIALCKWWPTFRTDSRKGFVHFRAMILKWCLWPAVLYFKACPGDRCTPWLTSSDHWNREICWDLASIIPLSNHSSSSDTSYCSCNCLLVRKRPRYMSARQFHELF